MRTEIRKLLQRFVYVEILGLHLTTRHNMVTLCHVIYG